MGKIGFQETFGCILRTNSWTKFLLNVALSIMENDKEKAKRLSMVALSCAHSYPQDRPSMSTVVKMLEGEIEPWPPRLNPFPYYDSSCGESIISGGSTRTQHLPLVVLPAYGKRYNQPE